LSNELVLRPAYPISRMQQRETITFRHAQITFRNFSGRPTPFNQEGGVRAFSIVLDERLAKELADKGLNVKPLRKRDEDEEQMYHLPVAVNYERRPPRVYMVTGDGNTLPFRKALLTEELVHMMDNLDLAEAHMMIAISNYKTPRGERGKKAYLQSFFGHIVLDELEQEYATVEDMIHVDTEQHRDVDAEDIGVEVIED